MVCREWQRQIPDFLNGRMAFKEQAQFIVHVRQCRDCYEELEIMYMLAEGLKELENGSDNSFNFKHMLNRKLKTAQLQCERYRRLLRVRVLILGTMYAMTALGVIIQIWQWI